MARLTHVTGLSDVIRNMRSAKGAFAAGTGRGLKKGGLHLQAKSEEICPVDLGVLKNSSFCRNVGGVGFDTDVIVGYTAEYAATVHEDLTKAHGEAFNIKHATEIAAGTMPNRGENQQAKYLERPARDERRTILKIIHREAKL